MRKWTLDTAIRAYLFNNGLSRCSAIDYLNKYHKAEFEELKGNI